MFYKSKITACGGAEYVYSNSQGERLFTVEKPDCCSPGCWSLRRQFSLLEETQFEVMRFVDSSVFQYKMDIYYPVGLLLGFVKLKKNCCTFHFTVNYKNHGKAFKIRLSDNKECCRLYNWNFSIFDVNEVEIGSLTHVHRGFNKAKYEITFPAHLKTDLKILLMGACMLLVSFGFMKFNTVCFQFYPVLQSNMFERVIFKIK